MPGLERVVLQHGKVVCRRASSSPARQQLRNDGQVWGKKSLPQPPKLAQAPKATPKPVGNGQGSNPSRKPGVILPRVNKTPAALQGLGPNGKAIVTAAAANGAKSTTPVIEDPLARPSWKTLQLLALQRGVPFIGFGFVDNAIMIISGDYIEMNIGVALGIGTMTAAALGNVFADVVGLNLGGMIEEVSHRMGIPEPKLSKPQLEMGVTRIAAYSGSSSGIAFGCLLGMLPLLFLTDEVREGSPADVCNTLAQRAAELLHCERAVVYHVDPSSKRILQQYNSGGGAGSSTSSNPQQPVLSPALSRELSQQVLFTEEGATLTILGPEELMEGKGGGAEVAETTITTEPDVSGVRSVLSMPVLNQEGKVIAIVTAVNRKVNDSFSPEDYKTMAGVCAQVAESIINMSRRPEEHVSLTENLGLLRVHSNLAIKPYIPSLSALMGRDAEGDTQGRNKRIVVRTEMKIGGLIPTRQQATM